MGHLGAVAHQVETITVVAVTQGAYVVEECSPFLFRGSVSVASLPNFDT